MLTPEETAVVACEHLLHGLTKIGIIGGDYGKPGERERALKLLEEWVAECDERPKPDATDTYTRMVLVLTVSFVKAGITAAQNKEKK